MRDSVATDPRQFFSRSTFALLAPMVLICFMLLGTSAHAAPAYEAPPGGWSQNSLGFSLRSEYFMSKANYADFRGSYKRLPVEGSFSTLAMRAKGRYNFSPRWSLFGGSGFGYSKAVDPLNEKTNSQLTDLFLGLDFLVNKKFLHLIPEVEAGFPVSATDKGQSNPLTSDGVPYLRAGVFGHHPFRKFRLGGYAGVHVPFDGLAKRFLYEITADMRLFSMFTIGLGFDGYETIISDELKYADRNRTAVLANAGSMRYFSYDPALMEGRLWIGFRPDRTLWIRAGYAKTVDGMYTAEGQSFVISIAWNSNRLDHGTDALVDRAVPNQPGPTKRPDQNQAIKAFEADVETTEQGIFEMEAAEQPSSPLDSTEKDLEKKNEDSRNK